MAMAFKRVRKDGVRLSYYQVRLPERYDGKIRGLMEQMRNSGDHIPSAAAVLGTIIRQRLDEMPVLSQEEPHHD